MSEEAFDSPNFLANLRMTVKECSSKLDNLTHWIANTDFRKYLETVSESRLRELLQGLLNENDELAQRIDVFKREIDADYATCFNQNGKKIPLTWIAVLLASLSPDTHVFCQRNKVIKTVCSRWNIELSQEGTDGESMSRI